MTPRFFSTYIHTTPKHKPAPINTDHTAKFMRNPPPKPEEKILGIQHYANPIHQKKNIEPPHEQDNLYFYRYK